MSASSTVDYTNVIIPEHDEATRFNDSTTTPIWYLVYLNICNWININANKYVLDIIRYGFYLPFTS